MTEAQRYSQLPKLLLPWYRKYARQLPWRLDQEPYHVWLSEIMLQQTRVEAVKGYYTRFLKALPTVQELAAAQEDDLLKLWEGLGYYNRARNLQKAAQMVISQYDGIFPSEYEKIRSLPGIGEYTAGAIASICFEQPYPAVDGNVLRLLSRVMDSNTCIDDAKVKQAYGAALAKIYPKGSCGAFTQALMELGATVCVPNGIPLCDSCPLHTVCLARSNGTQFTLPVRRPKKKRRVEEKTVFLFWNDGCLALNKREEPGVLNGMWELPNTAGLLSRSQAAQLAQQWGVEPVSLEQELERNHIFTHIEWKMRAYVFQCSCRYATYVWVDDNLLKNKYALPSAFRQFL